jgi:tellurite resistance protein
VIVTGEKRIREFSAFYFGCRWFIAPVFAMGSGGIQMASILSKSEVDLFARAMYYVATVDGVDPREVKVIKDFCKEAGHPELSNEIEKTKFRPEEAAMVLETSDKRRLLMKALFVLVKADGVISQPERTRLLSIADTLGLSHALDELETVAG